MHWTFSCIHTIASTGQCSVWTRKVTLGTWKRLSNQCSTAPRSGPPRLPLPVGGTAIWVISYKLSHFSVTLTEDHQLEWPRSPNSVAQPVPSATASLPHWLIHLCMVWQDQCLSNVFAVVNAPNRHLFECSRFACAGLTFAYYFLNPFFTSVSSVSYIFLSFSFHFLHSSLLLFIPSLLPSLYLFLYLHSTTQFPSHPPPHLTYTFTFTFTTKNALFSNYIHHSPLIDTHFRNVFGVDPAIQVEEMSKAEQVMLDSSWSAKITITGMYHFC